MVVGKKMSKICNNCGKEVKDEFDFCVYCGSELPKRFICPDCKEEYLESDYEYCGKCGGKLMLFDLFNEMNNLDSLPDNEKCKIFWSKFFNEADKTENNFTECNRDPQNGYNRFSMNGITGSVLETRGLFKKEDYIEIKILIHNDKDLYRHLAKRKDYYNEQFPKDLIWRENKKNARNIALIIDDLSIRNSSDWDEIIHQFINQMNKFCEVFSDDIKEFMD